MKNKTLHKSLSSLINKFYKLNEQDRLNLNNNILREEYIDPLFRILGWSININGYKIENHSQNNSFLFGLDGKPFMYREDIPLNGWKPNAKYSKLTIEEQKAIDFAYNQKIPLTVITNFVNFRIFDTQHSIPIVSIDSPKEYLNYIETLEALNPNMLKSFSTKLPLNILKDTLSRKDLDLIQKLRLKLANNIYELNKDILLEIMLDEKNIELLQHTIQSALMCIIIISYAEDKKFIGQTISDELSKIRQSEINIASLMSKLRSHFRDIPEIYNSKIFTFRPLKQLLINPQIILSIFEDLRTIHFNNFSIYILGEVYEAQLSYLLQIDEKSDTLKFILNNDMQKNKGIYYTNPKIIKHINENTLPKLLENKTYKDIRNIKVVDMAMGPGSFLLYAYYLFWQFYHNEQIHIEEKIKNSISSNETEQLEIELIEIKKALDNILTYHIYGVDLDKGALEIAIISITFLALELGLNPPSRLHRNLKIGNSLISGVRDKRALEPSEEDLINLIDLREAELETETKEENEKILNKIKRKINRLNKHFNATLETILKDFQAQKPFNWEIEFPEVFDPRLPEQERGFTLIMGNPPYISFYSRQSKKIYNKEDIWFFKNTYKATSGRINTYVMFIENALPKLIHNGYLGMIVPTPMLAMKTYMKLRKLILDTSCIEQIVTLGSKMFSGADVSTMILILKKHLSVVKCSQNNIEIFYKLPSSPNSPPKRKIKQELFGYFEQQRFNIYLDEKTLKVIQKIQAISYELGAIAKVRDGINPGPFREKLLSNEKLNETYYPLLQGSDISRYFVSDSGMYIRFDSNYINYLYETETLKHPNSKAVLGNKDRFEVNEKILTRQTSGEIIAAYDDQQYYITNSVHSIEITEEPIDTKYILAILNSNLMRYYYRKVFKEKNGLFPQVKIGHLKQLPIHWVNTDEEKELHDYIVERANKIIELKKKRAIIFDTFARNIDKEEPKYALLEKLILCYPELDINILNDTLSGHIANINIEEKENDLIFSAEVNNKRHSILKLHIENNDFRLFISLAYRHSIFNKYNKKTGKWKLRGARHKWGNGKAIDVILRGLLLPYFSTKTDTFFAAQPNYHTIQNIIATMKSSLSEFDVYTLEEQLSQLEIEINEAVYNLYELKQEEIELLTLEL